MYICQIAFYGSSEYELPDEAAFWLYASVMEEILPIGFSSQVVEPLVLSKIFNKLFEILDPHAFEILGDIPSALFIKYFVCLFAEYPNESVSTLPLVIFIDLTCDYGPPFLAWKRYDDIDFVPARPSSDFR